MGTLGYIASIDKSRKFYYNETPETAENMAKRKNIIIGSRGSRLALAQAEMVLSKLQAQYPRLKFKIKKIKTKGDKIKSAILLRKAGKGLFVKELERALLKGKIDIAVHSMKDVPTDLPTGLTIGTILERENPQDAFIGRNNIPFEKLPAGTKIGTSSLRRQSQLLAQYKSLIIKDLRGNIDTRIRKVRNARKGLGGIILAAAGIKRLYPSNEINFELLPVNVIVPAPAQGAICLETRSDDDRTNKIIFFLHHAPTATTVTAERRLLAKLEGGCQIPLGVYGELQGDGLLKLTAVLALPDGSKSIKDSTIGSADSPKEVANALYTTLCNKGARELLAKLNKKR